jgi:putative ABC transport system substrate-binding protein
MVAYMDKSAISLKYPARFVLILLFLTSFSAVSSGEKIPVGVILTGDIPYYREIHESFVEGLKAESYGPDKIEIILQKPVPNTMSWTNAVRKLVTFDAKVIISYGGPATLTAVNESSGIPVIFAAVYMPEDMGISMKNATGISSDIPVASILKKLSAIVNYSKLGIIYSASEEDTVIQARKAQALAETMNFTSEVIDLAKKRGRLDLSGLDAIFMTTSCAGMRCVDDIVGLARKAKIPTAASIGGAAEKGVLLTISANTHEQGVVASSMVAEVLRGSSPSAIAPKRATKIEFVVNLREANSLGLKIPFDLLTGATRAIK